MANPSDISTFWTGLTYRQLGFWTNDNEVREVVLSYSALNPGILFFALLLSYFDSHTFKTKRVTGLESFTHLIKMSQNKNKNLSTNSSLFYVTKDAEFRVQIVFIIGNILRASVFPFSSEANKQVSRTKKVLNKVNTNTAQMLTFNRPRFETVVRTWSAQNVEFLICFWTPRKSMLWTHVVVVWKITFWRKSGNYHTLEELELHWVVRVNTECISDRKNSVNQATSHWGNMMEGDELISRSCLATGTAWDHTTKISLYFFQGVYLKPFSMAMALMFFQQFSGINAVIFYLQNIFNAAGTEINPPGMSAFIVCLVQVI